LSDGPGPDVSPEPGPTDHLPRPAQGLRELSELLHARFQPKGEVIAEQGAPLLDVDEDLLDRFEVAMPIAATLALADSLCAHGRLLAAGLEVPGSTRAAVASVARGAVEAGVRLWYLSTADGREERTRRFLLDRVYDLQEEERLFGGVSGARRTAALQEAVRLRQLKEAALTEPLIRGHKRPSSMVLLDAIMGSPGAGLTASRLMSALAHARPAVLLRDWTVAQPPDDHIQLIRVQESQEDLAGFALPALVSIWRGGAMGLQAIGRPLTSAESAHVERLVGMFARPAQGTG